jgi:hypothetical protein
MLNKVRYNTNGTLSRGYRKWTSMMQRCYNPRHPAYDYYGGRGIEVCAQWRGRGGFDVFVADMGEPLPGYWLERKDGSKGYEPGNCCWATPKEQAANRGKVGPEIDPNSRRQRAIRSGLDPALVANRIRSGWTEEKALATPVQPRGRPFGYRIKT